MNRIIDRFILLIYCLGCIYFVSYTTNFLVAFLAAVIYCCLDYYMKGWKHNWLIHLAFLLVFLCFPACSFFLPLALYGTWEDQKYGLSTHFFICGLYHQINAPLPVLFLIVLGTGIAIFIEHKTKSYETLLALYKHTRDDGAERNLLLKEKNQALLEKQNYEIYTATLKERNRIAREIHDNVGHMLSRAILMNGALKTINKDAALNTPLEQMGLTLNTAMTNIRESVHDLHNDSINLHDVLENIINNFQFCKLQFSYDIEQEVPRSIKYCFITIVKEALNNIIKHSNATSASITLREHPALYQLIIKDNGTSSPYANTDFQTITAFPKGLGLINMQDRVEALNGRIQISSDKGFQIFITIPKKEAF